MTLTALIAAAYTFTASATGVEKGTPLEFLFAGAETDRDYETMFLLDKPIGEICREIEKTGLPCGRPVDARNCLLWPVGCELTISPPIADFVDSQLPDGISLGAPIYTGGTRLADGALQAEKEMPMAFFSLYTLAQSPILFNGLYEQGQVYGCHKAKLTLKKGEKRTFTLSWKKAVLPKTVSVKVMPGQAADILRRLKEASSQGEIDVRVSFADDLTLAEATAFAQALAIVDSVNVKINGRDKGDFFYRAFLPLVKWRDRKERLTQPFEIRVGPPDQILFISEDWSVEGLDPKLTEVPVSYDDLTKYPNVDTAFLYARPTDTVKSLKRVLARLPEAVRNHYVFAE